MGRHIPSPLLVSGGQLKSVGEDPAHIRDDVKHKLAVLEETLLREPLIVADADRALKEAVSKIVLDPEAAMLAIYWHHASEPSDGVPFFSRHFRGFDDAENGTT